MGKMDKKRNNDDDIRDVEKIKIICIMMRRIQSIFTTNKNKVKYAEAIRMRMMSCEVQALCADL